MDKKALERIQKHLGTGGYVELHNEDGTQDKFYMNMIPVQFIGELFYVMTRASGKKEDDFFKELNPGDFSILTKLVKESLKESPELAELAEPDLDKFITANFLPLVTKMFEINDLGSRKLTKDREAIKRAQHIRKLREKHGQKASDGVPESQAAKKEAAKV